MFYGQNQDAYCSLPECSTPPSPTFAYPSPDYHGCRLPGIFGFAFCDATNAYVHGIQSLDRDSSSEGRGSSHSPRVVVAFLKCSSHSGVRKPSSGPCATRQKVLSSFSSFCLSCFLQGTRHSLLCHSTWFCMQVHSPIKCMAQRADYFFLSILFLLLLFPLSSWQREIPRSQQCSVSRDSPPKRSCDSNISKTQMHLPGCTVKIPPSARKRRSINIIV